MPKCGAKTRSGGKCGRNAVVGGKRCKLHGGVSTGPRDLRDNKNAAKPGGLYSQFLTQSEQDAFDSIELGKIDDELRLARIRLMRALRDEEAKGNRLELTERVKREGGKGIAADREDKLVRRDYPALIDRLMGRIESLEKTRIALIKDNPPGAGDTGLGKADYTLAPDEQIPANPIL